MYLFVGLCIGAIYGRNAHAVNQKTYEDIQKIFTALRKTKLAFNLYYVTEKIFDYFDKKHSVVYTHDILCTCNRRSCKPVSINTYVRKLKAAN